MNQYLFEMTEKSYSQEFNIDQTFVNVKTYLKKYFKMCFKNLINRMGCENLNYTNKLDKITFSKYMRIPKILSDRIFNLCNYDKDDTMDKNKFVNILFEINCAEEENLNFFIFHMLRNNSDKISFHESTFILSHIEIEEEEKKKINEEISKFFGTNISNGLSFQEYNKKINSENNINPFKFILNFIYERQPYLKNSIQYYLDNFTEYNKNSEDEYPYVKLLSRKLKRKFASKNILSYENNKNVEENLIKKEEENSYNDSICHFQSTNDSYSNNFTNIKSESISDDYYNKRYENILEFVFQKHSKNKTNKNVKSDYFETFAYRLSEEKKLKKNQIQIRDMHIFGSIFCKIKNEFKLQTITPLSGFFPSKCDPTKIKDQVMYPLALSNQYGNTFSNLENILFFRKKDDMINCYEFLIKEMSFREISTFYNFYEVIGKGNYSKVKLAIKKDTKEKFAVKIIKKKMITENQIENVFTELEIMKFLINNNHRNIVRVFDIFEDKTKIFIVMEYISGGSLNNFLNEKNSLLNREQILIISKEVAQGISFLHNSRIIHRDIKPDNILLDFNNENFNNFSTPSHVKITDFGLSKILNLNENTFESFGTLVYTAPEILLKSNYNFKVDIWSFGILLYYITIGELPFDGNGVSMDWIANKICFLEIERDNFINIDEKIKSLIKNCLIKIPAERYNIKRVLNSDLFKK